MKPPQHLIDGMLADGLIGVLSSIISLAAIISIQRGEPVTGFSQFGPEPDPRLRAVLLQGVEKAREMWVNCSASELEHGSALYRAHLKAAGYTLQEGYDQ